MAPRVWFQRVSIRDFRNLESVELEPGPGLNVITGDNGQGKTSLLEALYFVASSRSFRSERLATAIRHGAEAASVRVRVEDKTSSYEQHARLAARSRSLTLDGKKPERLTVYATRTPVVVFHPGDLLLVSAEPLGRRKLLDRIALHLDPLGADARSSYLEALRARQVVLETRGVRAPELDAFEPVLAERGARYAQARELAAQRLIEALAPAFAGMASAETELATEYRPGGTPDAQEFARELAERRASDLRRRRPSFGPQRDELELRLTGRSARHQASQGQQRILALALKLAELACVREAHGADPVLLLDDVSSELDPARTGSVYRLLEASQSQIFVTTTRLDLFRREPSQASERSDWEVLSGRFTRR